LYALKSRIAFCAAAGDETATVVAIIGIRKTPNPKARLP
jgi:hypothetical protein